jgi:DNA-binding MarR family transcriptional regulator/N-acetylglutamate synthase-like GNAT family acetyltransferase
MAPSGDVSTSTVDAVRAFNRFYTRRLGLLDDRHLRSTLSLAEVRALYEVAHEPGVAPSALAEGLGLDPGYVSRIVASLERQGFVSRAAASDDGRRSALSLTTEGRRTFAALERATRAQVGQILAGLTVDDRVDLVAAMNRIERLLEPQAPVDRTFVLRDPHPGDIGWIIHRQGALYAAEYGWDWTYEGLIAGICAKFIERFDPTHEHCWIAERDGAIVGSVFLVRRSKTVAQLRLLYVEPSARGLGIGARLVDECIGFARRCGYRKMMLWTNDVLVSARKIYVAAGFTLVEEEPHRSFGHDLVGQNWSLDLATARPHRGR